MSDQPNSSGSEEQKIRDNLVNTAVNFLLNPGVINKPDEHKTAFLKKKGLTDAEISLAYKKAESDPKFNTIQRNALSSVVPPPIPVYSRPISFWARLSNFSSSLIVLGVAVFGAHYFYKKFIEPMIFGEVSRNKSSEVEEQLVKVAILLTQLQKTVSSLEETVKTQKVQMDKYLENEANEYYPTPLALKELRTEVGSIKAMLLNRHQFPAIPKVTPTIPQWQLPTNSDAATAEQNELQDRNEQQDSKSSEVPVSVQENVPSENGENIINTNGDMNNMSDVNEIPLADNNIKMNSELAVS